MHLTPWPGRRVGRGGQGTMKPPPDTGLMGPHGAASAPLGLNGGREQREGLNQWSLNGVVNGGGGGQKQEWFGVPPYNKILILVGRLLGKAKVPWIYSPPQKNTTTTTYRQLRARRALLQINDVPLRTRRELLPLTLYSNSALLVLNGTSLSCNNALLALNWRYISLMGWDTLSTGQQVFFFLPQMISLLQRHFVDAWYPLSETEGCLLKKNVTS